MKPKGPWIHKQALVESKNIGDGTRIWAFAHVMENVTIGKNCNIGDHVFIESSVTIGNNVTVKNGVSIWQHVHIEDHVFLGPNVTLTNDRFPRADNPSFEAEETWIGEGATVGANSTILCGVRLGTRCFVGAGSVVTRDVPSQALVFGNPAGLRGWVCHCGKPLEFSEDQSACSVCKRQYRLIDSQISETD